MWVRPVSSAPAAPTRPILLGLRPRPRSRGPAPGPPLLKLPQLPLGGAPRGAEFTRRSGGAAPRDGTGRGGGGESQGVAGYLTGKW
ncbi:hypothetical protein FE633_16305 [Streptomyces montanus]|uniref:Uncharacterized protein n=1 Tax=Streptomyces montanus TaxID=2580423 RepID=A0A5R9FT24_9ACTN|nr:hypothetical protein FE633_16305 [Streptomyces montanus]